VDGREHRYCEGCHHVIEDMPPEVLFGIQINANGDVYFSMNNKQWFDKIFKNDSYGVSVDIVSLDKYACNKETGDDFSLPKGTMLPPVYRSELLKEAAELMPGNIFTKIGKVPPALHNKQLEGNLVILNGNYICYYTNFVNIDRSLWKLLPMGLFTDSLINEIKTGNEGDQDYFSYTKRVQLEIPFSKSNVSFDNDYLRTLYDSLKLKNYRIQQIDVRAYASVEGAEKLNEDLMKRRADAIIQALKIYQPSIYRIKIVTAENWLEFFNDIDSTPFSNLKQLSKIEIKQKLTDTALSVKIEPLLAKERKVVAAMYLETKSVASTINDSSIEDDFSKAVDEKDIGKARMIQKELFDRIIDKRFPTEYITKIEVPQSKEFSSLLNDREVYKYLLKTTTEYEALDNFLSLQKLDPGNGHVNYNICVLRFFMWQYGGDSTVPKMLLKNINDLSRQGINDVLVKRMLVNYYILKSEDQMNVFDYDGKDSSLEFIKNLYDTLNLNDEDIFSLAKYFAFYARQDWSEEIITPRIDKVDASEDLIFYYLNLLFFNPSEYYSDDFEKAALNAINLNRKRFCNFFLPNDKGGASMQLLDYDQIKKLYCQECK